MNKNIITQCDHVRKEIRKYISDPEKTVIQTTVRCTLESNVGNLELLDESILQKPQTV